MRHAAPAGKQAAVQIGPVDTTLQMDFVLSSGGESLPRHRFFRSVPDSPSLLAREQRRSARNSSSEHVRSIDRFVRSLQRRRCTKLYKSMHSVVQRSYGNNFLER